MEKCKGYQKLALLLRKKISFLNSHILYLMFTMAGTIDSSKEIYSGIPNIPAFRDVLCDLELWHEAPQELEKSLFEHFYELLADTSESALPIYSSIFIFCWRQPRPFICFDASWIFFIFPELFFRHAAKRFQHSHSPRVLPG